MERGLSVSEPRARGWRMVDRGCRERRAPMVPAFWTEREVFIMATRVWKLLRRFIFDGGLGARKEIERKYEIEVRYKATDKLNTPAHESDAKRLTYSLTNSKKMLRRIGTMILNTAMIGHCIESRRVENITNITHR